MNQKIKHIGLYVILPLLLTTFFLLLLGEAEASEYKHSSQINHMVKIGSVKESPVDPIPIIIGIEQ